LRLERRIDELSDYRIPKMSPMANRKKVMGENGAVNFFLDLYNSESQV
jgi:hypothetical protein